MPGSPVNDLQQVLADPFAAERGILQPLTGRDDVQAVKFPVSFAATPVTEYRPAPELGADQPEWRSGDQLAPVDRSAARPHRVLQRQHVRPDAQRQRAHGAHDQHDPGIGPAPPHFAVENTVSGTARTAGDGPVPTRRASAQPTAMRTELVRGARRRRASGRGMTRPMAASSHRGVMPVVFTHTRARIQFTLTTAMGIAHRSPSEIYG